MPKSTDALLARYADYNALTMATGLMNWDRQVLMPPGGGEARTAHVGRLTRMAHELFVSDETQRIVEEAAKEAETDEERAAIRVMRRELEIKTKLPTSLVERKAKVSSDAYDVWKVAKAESNFAMLAPYLQELFDIARETAERRGYTDHVYDPLIDLFEEGAKQADAQRMFDSIKQPIGNLVRHRFRLRQRPPRRCQQRLLRELLAGRRAHDDAPERPPEGDRLELAPRDGTRALRARLAP
jgi:carboxypeptidase Taq